MGKTYINIRNTKVPQLKIEYCPDCIGRILSIIKKIFNILPIQSGQYSIFKFEPETQ